MCTHSASSHLQHIRSPKGLWLVIAQDNSSILDGGLDLSCRRLETIEHLQDNMQGRIRVSQEAHAKKLQCNMLRCGHVNSFHLRSVQRGHCLHLMQCSVLSKHPRHLNATHCSAL